MWTSQTALAGFFDVPEAIELAIQYVNGRYKGTPVYITENGELHIAFCGSNPPVIPGHQINQGFLGPPESLVYIHVLRHSLLNFRLLAVE
jgi:hypothetical protein